MGPLWTFETGELRVVFEIDAGCAGFLDDSGPRASSRSEFVLVFLELSANREPHKHDFAAAGLDLFHGCRGVGETLLGRFSHEFRKSLRWHITRRGRRSEEGEPAVFHPVLQWPRLGGGLGHARAAIPFSGLKIGRQRWR